MNEAAMARIAAKASRRAHRIAQEIVDEIATNPHTPQVSGRLRYSYYVDTGAAGTAVIKSSAPYWKYVEFGTYKDEAQPHVGPAIEVIKALHRG